jgi:glycosyltransferase involved in cell wall biosynthesis
MWEQSSFGADADIVEACDWGCLFIPPAVEADRPLVVQCHGSIGQVAMHDPIVGEETRDMLEQLLERSVMARANKVQTYSRANAEFWQQEACREVDMISPAFLSAMLPDQPIANHGLVVGRLQQWKGPQVVCNALRLVGGKSLRIQWLGRDMPWGSGQTSSSSHLARAFPDIWGTQLIHGPPVARDEVDRLQSRALFNVVPSTWDVFNFTAIEAMASGRPTIVSTGAGASEIIEDGINGFLFPAGDASALAAAIDRVLCIPPKQLAELGALARETVRRCFDPDRIAVQRIAAYRAAMDSFKKTKPTPIGGWLGRVCRPAAQADEGSMAFLDQHPLRDILRYSMGRLSRRLGLQ